MDFVKSKIERARSGQVESAEMEEMEENAYELIGQSTENPQDRGTAG